MSDHLAIRLPFERGQQLRDLAAANGLTITDTVGLLIDCAAANGLGTLTLPGIDITINDERTHVMMAIDKISAATFSPVDAHSTAGAIRIIASGRRPATLHMDSVNTVEITRSGVAVVITIHGDDGVVVKKTISRGVARAVADRLDTAADLIEIEAFEAYENATAESVKDLLGDLESGDIA